MMMLKSCDDGLSFLEWRGAKRGGGWERVQSEKKKNNKLILVQPQEDGENDY
jgi:hypothetical protein